MTLRPVIVTANTAASADIALAVLSPRSLTSLGAVTYAALKEFDAPALVLTDAASPRLTVTTDATMKAALLALRDSAWSWIKVSPNTNKMLSHWDVVDSLGWTDVSYWFHANNKRSVLQVVNFLGGPFFTNQFCFVDQDSNSVTAFQPPDSAAFAAAVAALTPLGETVTYSFTGLNVTGQIFE